MEPEQDSKRQSDERQQNSGNVLTAATLDQQLTIHTFYHKVLKLLSRFVRGLKSHNSSLILLSDDDIRLADRCLSMLYLWAHGLDLQYLENQVDKETGLQAIVADLLADIASILVSDICLSLFNPLIGESLNISQFRMSYVDEDEFFENDTIISSPDRSNTSNTDESNVQDDNSGQKYAAALERIYGHVDALMNLLPTIDSCCHEEVVVILAEDPFKAEGTDILTEAQPYVMQILDKYSSINESLAQRLGQANYERFHRIQAISSLVEEQQDTELLLEEELENKATSTFAPFSEFKDSGLGSSLPTNTRYARSNASHASLLSTETAFNRGAPRVPPTPAEVISGIPFKCEICQTKLTKIRNRGDWKLHVFQDLQPYICTFDECIMNDTTFATREAWASHDLHEHRRQTYYRCYICMDKLETSNSCLEHMTTYHSDLYFNDDNLQDLVSKICQMSVSNDVGTEKCPLCLKQDFSDRKLFVSHVCRHMEEIALIVLPSDDSDTDEADSDMSAEDALKAPLEIPAGETRLVGTESNNEAASKYTDTERKEPPVEDLGQVGSAKIEAHESQSTSAKSFWDSLSVAEKQACFDANSAPLYQVRTKSFTKTKTWAVKGPLQQEWTRLLPHILESYSVNNTKSSSFPVQWSLYLVGRKPRHDLLKPTIVVLDRDLTRARIAASSLKQEAREEPLATLLAGYAITYAEYSIQLA